LLPRLRRHLPGLRRHPLSGRRPVLGIAPEHLERLFSPFDRLGAEQSSIQGTGLGLALSKLMVEAMNGRLAVESVVDVGSTFVLVLPTAEPASLEAPADAGKALSATSRSGP